MALFLLATGSQALLAECLGCPPGALLVRLHLVDGGSVRGHVVIRGSRVRDVIDRRPLPAEIAGREVWLSGGVEIWQAVMTQRRPYRGAEFLLRQWPLERDESGRILPRPDHRRPLVDRGERDFMLGGRSVLLIGEPSTIPLERVEWIEDISVPVGHYELLSPVYRVSSENRDLLLEEPRVSVVVWDQREVDDRVYYCFSYLQTMPPLELADKCVDEFDRVERGIIKLLFPGST